MTTINSEISPEKEVIIDKLDCQTPVEPQLIGIALKFVENHGFKDAEFKLLLVGSDCNNRLRKRRLHTRIY